VAAGVASEVLVWLFVAVMSSLKNSSPLLAGAVHAAYAVGFFLVMMTVGRRFTFWAMRRVRDLTGITRGQESLVLALTFVAAAITEALGLHALLGAFVFGVLLSVSPRTNEQLRGSLQSLTFGLFGPIFFTLAGMRVDVLQLTTLSAVGAVLLLLVVATGVKIGFTALGARLGGQAPWESALIGVGVNLKGGTDVIVAVVGTELGLLTARTYTMYAVVAILTVFFSPLLIRYLERKAPPSKEEHERLEAEEASRRAYVPTLERVLVPVSKELLGSLAASVVERIAHSKHEQGQILDIMQLEVQRNAREADSRRARDARNRLDEAGSLKTVELRQESVEEKDVVESILKASTDFDLIAIGAKPPRAANPLSLGALADSIVDQADADVLVAINHQSQNFDCGKVNSILVPTNGLEYSMAAGDIAGSLAHACNARMVLLHVVKPSDSSTEGAVESATGVLDELAFRIGRLGVQVEKRTEVSKDPSDVILGELSRREHDLVVMGGRDRGRDGKLYLGNTIGTVLTRDLVPAILVVSHGVR
jgi:nucleotide-binding universal stress UspA family protein